MLYALPCPEPLDFWPLNCLRLMSCLSHAHSSHEFSHQRQRGMACPTCASGEIATRPECDQSDTYRNYPQPRRGRVLNLDAVFHGAAMQANRAVYGSFTLGLPSGLRIVHPGFTELRSAPPMRTNAENGRLAVGLTPRSGWRVADITRGEVSPRSSRVTSWPCMCL